MTANAVYMVYHIHPEDDVFDEDWKLVGIYNSEEKARQAISRIKAEPGFRDHPEGFQISRYALNQDHWTEGYVRAS